jgi:hypothetical protein
MKKAWVALGAGALAIALVASTFDTAEARHRGGGGGFRSGGWGGGGARFVARSYSAPRFVARSSFAGVHRHRHVRRAFVGVPLAYGAYGYGSGCSWLRYRALETGSRYWWSRYYDCVNGYY